MVIDGAPAIMGESVTISGATKTTTRTYFNNLAKATVNGILGYKSTMNFGIGVDGAKVSELRG